MKAATAGVSRYQWREICRADATVPHPLIADSDFLSLLPEVNSVLKSSARPYLPGRRKPCIASTRRCCGVAASLNSNPFFRYGQLLIPGQPGHKSEPSARVSSGTPAK